MYTAQELWGALVGAIIAVFFVYELACTYLYDGKELGLKQLIDDLTVLRALLRIDTTATGARQAMLEEVWRHWKGGINQ